MIEAIKKIDKEVKSTYGRNRMTIAVNNKLNTKYNSKKIRRIMIENDITCVIRVKKKRYIKPKAEYIAENILKRDFNTTCDNQKYSTDITEIKTNEGKLYLSAVIDMHSKKIISHKIGESNNNKLVFNTFKEIMNDTDIDFKKVTLQSDRGFQYTSYQFKEIIKDITHSMNKPGSCADNSPIESFWGVFKVESYYNPLCKEYFKTKELAIKTINEYIEFYNNKRINLKGTTPNEIRNNSLNLSD